MSKEQKPEDAMINSQLLTDKAYKDTKNLDRRKALYQFTYPNFSIEDEVIKLHQLGVEASLLDVGCGTGKLLLKTAELLPKAHLVGVDIAPGMYLKAQEQARRDNLPIDFQTGDVQSLQFPDNSFDRVTAMHMLYHAPDIDQALRELARVVKPTGIVLITANSEKSRAELGFLKAQAARSMGRDVFTDPNRRFNLENGLEKVKSHFDNANIIMYESALRLTDSQPYVDYFDSLREFWEPTPQDEEWSAVLDQTKRYVEKQIEEKGVFTDTLGFGVIVASHSPLPSGLI